MPQHWKDMRSFRLETPEEDMRDLERRLAAIRWPRTSPGAAWQWGASASFMHQLVTHWQTGFDWGAWQDRLNAHEQFLVTISGTELHVVVEQGSGPDPLPLVLTHGWPGSVFELIDLIPRLAHPERFGGSVQDAFTVVVPSLPGFGFAPPPDHIMTPQEVAGLWHDLMTGPLNFDRYVAHGGDTGATVTSWMGLTRQDCLPAIHMNTPVLHSEMDGNEAPLDTDEIDFLTRQQVRIAGEDAYQHIHAEKPDTLAFSLADSPVGLAAWMVEKFHGWTEPDSPMLTAIGMDHILANVMAFWVGRSHPVHWMYQSLRDLSGYKLPAGQRVETPTGFCLFPNDIVVPPPRRWLERAYHVTHLTVASSGGHFPGIEQPDYLANDIRNFFQSYR